MSDVVGLRFVTEGERETLNAIQRYDRAQKALESTARSLEQAFARKAATEAQAVSAYAALERAGMTYANVLQGITQDERMAQATAQQRVNALLGVGQAFKSAADSARVFQAAASAQQSFARLEASLNPAVAASQKLAAAQETVDAAIEHGVVSAERGAQVMKQYRAAMDTTAASNARASAEIELLARAYNPAKAAAMVYERQVLQINRAHEIGVLDAKQLTMQLQQLDAAYERSGRSARHAHSFVNQFGSVAHIAGVKTNRFGMIAQQVGYQVGDFFVQVQSGTNAFVAFGQQATQLAGLLPGLAGAIVGIGISVGTMFLAMWDRTRKAKEGVDEFKKSIEAMQQAVVSADTELARRRFGVESPELAAGLAQLETLNKRLDDLRAKRDALAAAAPTGRWSLSQDAAYGRNAAELRAVEEQLKATNAEVDALKKSLGELSAQDLAKETLRVLGETRKAAADRLDLARARIAEYEREVALQQAILVYGQNSAQAEDARKRIVMAQVEAFIEQNKLTGQTADAVRAAADSAYTAAAATSEWAARMSDVRGEINAILAALSNIGGVAISNAAKAAEIQALRAGQSVSDASRTARRFQRDTEFDARAQGASLFGRALIAVERGLANVGDELDSQLEQERALARLRDRTTGGGGGGGTRGELTDLQAVVAEMDRRIDRQNTLNRLYGDARRAQELVFEIQDKLKDTSASYTQQEIEAAAQRIAAREAEAAQLQNLHDSMEGIASTMQSAMADAFTSIVDGTKSTGEAFREMARLIVAELFKVLVVQRLVGTYESGGGGILGALFGGFGAADGAVVANMNAPPGASVLPFANGGVVGGPTLFPMIGGKTGLMGEAGPEAIMPLKRGSNGKLGVSVADTAPTSNVVVNNHFHVAANGDESVKRIVAQQVPAIAEATKAAVMDARQRGGKMKAVFK